MKTFSLYTNDTQHKFLGNIWANVCNVVDHNGCKMYRFDNNIYLLCEFVSVKMHTYGKYGQSFQVVT